MLPSVEEILHLCGAIAVRARWRSKIPRRVIERCLDDARELDDRSGRPARELAALFHAFARDEGRLGSQAASSLPLYIVRDHMRMRGVTLPPGESGALLDVQNAIAEGTASFEDVVRWFEARLVSTLTRVKTRGES